MREDVSLEAWQTPPDEAFALWQCIVPAAAASERLIINDGLVYDCFTRLDGQDEPHKFNFRYVLALWLLRKRRMKIEEVQKQSDSDWLILRDPKVKKMHRLLNTHLNEEAIATAQLEVETMLHAA